MNKILAIIYFLILVQWVQGQAVQADFSIPSQACLNQNIKLTNQSSNAANYEWDFCQGDLSLTPIANSLGSIGGSVIEDVDVVFDGTNWYGFAASRGDNSILRLDFGVDLLSTPSTVNLGNVGSSLNAPTGIKVIKEAGQWYGFVTNYNDDESKSKITRIDFGNSLANTSLTAQAILTGRGGSDDGIDIVQYNSEWYIFYSSRNSAIPNAYVGILRLATITSLPGVADQKQHIIPGANYISGCKLIKQGGNWYGYVITNQVPNSLKRISFGNDLLNSSPAMADLGNALISSNSPYGLDIGFDEGNYILFVSTLEGNMIRVGLGPDLSLLPASYSDLGKLGILTNTLKFRLVKHQSNWIAFMCNYSTTNLFNVAFPGPSCGAEFNYSTVDHPLIKFSTQGTKSISLRSYSSSYVYDEINKTILINNQQSPDIDFSYTGICQAHSTDITATNLSGGISSYAWDFGDGGTSIVQNPIYVYATAGSYPISLVVTSTNGCENFISRQIKIYNPPVASFSIPPGLICTGNEFTFINNTPDVYEGNLSYQWFVETSPVAISRDLKYTFVSINDQDIELEVSIPGCSNEITQPIAGIQSGPTVGFTPIGQCESEMISFTNESSGSITDYDWDFGNGNTLHTTAPTNPSQVYNKGAFAVSLQVTSNNGCQSATSKPLLVYSKPQPDFFIELPPFSCSGTPSQFTNATPNLTDSNIASWGWSFGDENNGAAFVKNPLYTYSQAGDYNVSLTAISNFNCASTVTKLVAIQKGPPINFTNTPACVNQGTRFTDESGSDIKSWLWSIDNSTYAFSNPTHVFSAPGNYNAQLTVAGDNNCVATLSKLILVPIPPVLSFTSSNACAGQPTTFQNTSPVALDPVTSLSWDFAGNVKGGSPVQYTFAPAGIYAVKMTSTQQSGCIYSISRNVVISPSPQAKFIASPEWGTPPLSVQFTNQSTGASTYVWNFNDKNHSTSTSVSPNFQFNDLGDYVVDLTATNAEGCSQTVSTKISVVIPTLDLELKELNLIKDPASGVYRVMVTIKNRSNFTLTNADVVVDISGNARVKETLVTTILPDGEVSQLLTNQIIPGSLFTYLCAELDVSNDLDQFNNKKCEPVTAEEIIFYPYPNPSNGKFYFDWIATESESVRFIIVNAMGQLVLEKDEVAGQIGLNQTFFDLNNLTSGVYYFKFISDTSIKTIPIMINR